MDGLMPFVSEIGQCHLLTRKIGGMMSILTEQRQSMKDHFPKTMKMPAILFLFTISLISFSLDGKATKTSLMKAPGST